MTPTAPPAHGQSAEILLRRGSVIESRHTVHAAVVDAEGGLRASIGQLVEPVFFRSAAKLFQALPLVEDGGVEHFGLTPPEIAVTCGSHGGEPLHVAVVASLLAKAGLTPEALRCGAHPPMHAPSAAELYRQGTPPGRIHNNCSGKHAGMLALAQLHGWPLEDYLEPDHPVQRRMLESVAAWTGIAPSGFLMGGDGCGVPAFAAPLPVLALGFARWMEAALRGSRDGAEGAPARVLQALEAAPEQLAGTGRLCTALVAGSEGRLVVKLGAEGVYGAALVRRGEVLGLALKVSDGAWRAVEVALVSALAALDPSLEELEGLRVPLGWGAGGWRRPAVPDTLGREAAHLEGAGFTPLERLAPRSTRPLAPGLRALIRLAGAQAARDARGVDRALAAVAARVVEGELDARAVEEAILQSLLFVGYPAALEGMQGWRRVSGTLPPPTADPRGREAWSMQGARLLGQVYGSQASVVRERMRAMHPDLGAWMLEEGYGKVLSRPGLPIGERELVNCALLAVQDAPRQLYSHLRGALHVGESVERIADVLAEVDPWIPGAEARARVYETWARVQEAWMRHAHRASDDEGQGRGIDVC
jgi:L-asparaginase II/alkylhydroperoxidase/carboxymuconolactone decarboxylase family protein YurZ